MSNRLTFSLASLIFLIAFGLVFAPVSVMAHDNASLDSATTPRWHKHPLTRQLDEQTNPNETPTDLGTSVLPHYGHPTVKSIKLKTVGNDKVVKGNEAVITADDTETAIRENALTLIVIFSEKVNTVNGAALTVTAADLLTAGDFTIRVRNAATSPDTTTSTLAEQLQ